VESLALELRRRMSAHPGAVPLMVHGPLDGPHALALNERLLDLLADAGLGPTEAARAAYLLTVYVLGSMALEVAVCPG
jgi:tetracycline repressor-like protein